MSNSTVYTKIDANPAGLSLGLRSAWKYRDLLLLFVRRDFVSFYKQTILGPIWFFLQPLILTLTYVFIFGNVAQLSADGLPHLLFYLSGVITWTYFADAVNQTSVTFIKNAQIFGKVYFPRIVVPLSVVITNLIKLGIQLSLFAVFLLYYIFNGYDVFPTLSILGFPLLVLLMATLGLGAGLIVSSVTTKYRDLQFLITFGVQLLMYASTVIFPFSSLSGNYKLAIALNPMSAIIETSRFMLLGSGEIPYFELTYSALFSLSVFLIGLFMFNKTEKNFMDTV